MMAVSTIDLSSAGVTEVRALTAETGLAFEVVGAAEGTEWVCTWTSMQNAEKTTNEPTIDTR